MVTYPEFTLAAVQSAPVFLDRDASTEKACHLIAEAGRAGADLAAFGECWLPGYPGFVWGGGLGSLWWQAAAEYLANAVEIPSPTTEQLCSAARRADVDVVIGVLELDPRSRGTAYCTLLFIGREGVILGRHRKLKPTGMERALWGEGDAEGLVAHQRAYGRISGLNCWEHNIILPSYVLAAQGAQIHVAAWPGSERKAAPASPVSIWTRQLLLSRAFASQVGAYVILASGLLAPEDVPEPYRDLREDWNFSGDSCIIDPRGEVIAGPAQGETILTARVTLEAVYAAKVACDVGGHYARPDIFQVLVNRQAPARLVERACGETIVEGDPNRRVANDAVTGGSAGNGASGDAREVSPVFPRHDALERGVPMLD